MPCMCSHVNKADSDRTWRSFKLQNIDASQPSLTSTADLFNQHSFKVDTIVSPIQYLTPMCNMVVCVCVWILKLRTKTFFLGHSDLWPSLTPSGHLCHIWRHALKVFLRYRGQENGKKRTNPRTQWSQLLLVLRNKYLKQDNVAGSEMIYQFIYQLPVFLPSSVLGLLPVSSYQPAGSHFFQTAQTKIDVVGWCLTGAS